MKSRLAIVVVALVWAGAQAQAAPEARRLAPRALGRSRAQSPASPRASEPVTAAATGSLLRFARLDEQGHRLRTGPGPQHRQLPPWAMPPAAGHSQSCRARQPDQRSDRAASDSSAGRRTRLTTSERRRGSEVHASATSERCRSSGQPAWTTADRQTPELQTAAKSRDVRAPSRAIKRPK